MMKTPIFRRKGYAMKDDTVVALRQPESFSDDPADGYIARRRFGIDRRTVKKMLDAQLCCARQPDPPGGRLNGLDRTVIAPGKALERRMT